MEKVIATPRVKKFRKSLEKSLNVKITVENDIAEIEGEGYEEYIALHVIDALNFGFEFNAAMQLKHEDYMLEKINLKKLARPSRLATIKGRIIGLKGKTKSLISELSGCDLAVKDSTVAIIGNTEDVDVAKKAVTSLIQGSPHSSVYAFLEKSRKIRKEKIDFDEDFIKK